MFLRRRFHQLAAGNGAFDFRMQFFNVARHCCQLFPSAICFASECLGEWRRSLP